MFKNILIIGHSNIGDVCYNLAVIAPLRSNFPDARISFLTSSRAKELVENYPGIERVITFDKHTRDKGIRGRLRLIKMLAKESFDLAIILKKSLFFIFVRVPRVWALKKKDVGNFLDKEAHIVEAYLDLLRSHGVSLPKEPEFNFKFSKGDLNFVDSFFKNSSIKSAERVITISPLSNWSLKCWPIENWKELIRVLTDTYGVKVILLGKESDDAYSKKQVKELSGFGICAINQSSLKQSMALIKRSNLFISSDSSLLHIASCMKVPSIGLYGPTATGRYYPFFHRQLVIKAEPVLSCMPCLNSSRFASCKAQGDEAPCMQAISVGEVLESVKRRLDIKP